MRKLRSSHLQAPTRKLPGTHLQVLDEEAALILVLGGCPVVPQVVQELRLPVLQVAQRSARRTP
jgi:hypothetical protein